MKTRVFLQIVCFLLFGFSSVKANVYTVTDTLNGFENALTLHYSHGSTDTIRFNVPGTGPHVIHFPYITIQSTLFINGSSQPGSSPGNWKIIFKSGFIIGSGVIFEGIQFENGLSLDDLSPITFENCCFHNCPTGIEIDDNNRYINIIGNSFISCKIGISILTNSTSNLSYYLRGNNFDSCNVGIFNKYSGTNVVERANMFNYCENCIAIPTGNENGLYIDSNTVTSYADTAITIGANRRRFSYDPATSYIYIRNNNINSVNSIFLFNLSGSYNDCLTLIDSNSISPKNGWGISFYGSTASVNGNKFYVLGNDTLPAILGDTSVFDENDISIANNEFISNNSSSSALLLLISNGGYGIYSNKIDGFRIGIDGIANTIENNNIKDCGTGIRIKSSSLQYPVIKSNTISFCNSDAINLIMGFGKDIDGCLISNIEIDSNTLINNGGSGFKLGFIRKSLSDFPSPSWSIDGFIYNLNIEKNIINNNDSAGIIMPFVLNGNMGVVPIYPVPKIEQASYSNGAYQISGRIRPNVEDENLMIQLYATDSTNTSNGVSGSFLSEIRLVDTFNVSIKSPYLGGYISAISKGYYYGNTSMLSNTFLIGKGTQNPCNAQFSISPDTIPHNWLALNTSTGTPPINYYWSWGDDSSIAGAKVSHTYSSPGYYNICLTILDSKGCTSTYCDSSTYLYRMDDNNTMVNINVVNSLPTGVQTVQPVNNKLILFPNPCTTCYIAGVDNPTDLFITDLLGRNVQASFTKSFNGYNIQMPASASGFYIIRNRKTGEALKFAKE